MSSKLQTTSGKWKGPPSSVMLSSNKKSKKQNVNNANESRESTPASSRSGTPLPTVTKRGTRLATSGRATAQKAKSFVQRMQLDDDDDDVGIEKELYKTDSESDDNLSADENADNNAAESECSYEESELSASDIDDTTPVKKKIPIIADINDEIDESTITFLELPSSSTDLLVSNKLVVQAFSVYEILRRFRSLIGLSPFLVEDFVAALVSDEHSVLIAEIHCALLKFLLHIEEVSGTVFGPQDVKDSVNITFYFLDALSWYVLIVIIILMQRPSDTCIVCIQIHVDYGDF